MDKEPSSEVTVAGHVYWTALMLSGIDPTGAGLNTKPALNDVRKDG